MSGSGSALGGVAGQGVVAFGRSLGEAQIISDIIDHTMLAIQGQKVWADGRS